MRTSIVIFSILLVGALAAPGYDECAPQDPSCQKAQPKCLSNDPSCNKPPPAYSSYTPEYSSNTPEYSSSTPEYSSNTPEYSSSTLTPEYSSKLTPEYSSNEPKPCSSEFYHPNGKCGLAEHGFLRCQYGLFCSQYGFCGAEPEYERNVICPKEERFDQYPLQYRSAPNDPIDYENSPSADPEPYAETAEVTYVEPMSTKYKEVEFYATPVPQVYVPPAVVVEEPYPSPYVQQYNNDAPESSYKKANVNDYSPSYVQQYNNDAPESSYKRADVNDYPSSYAQQYNNDAPESSYNKANANDCPPSYAQQYNNDAPESSYNKANANDCQPQYAQVYKGDAPEMSYKRANVYETYSSRSYKPKAKKSCWGSLFCQKSKKQEKERKRKHRQHKQCERQSC